MIEAWWNRYLQTISQQGVNKSHLMWYRRRVEQLLARHPGVHSGALRRSDVDAYFTALDGFNLPAWQLAQTLEIAKEGHFFI